MATPFVPHTDFISQGIGISANDRPAVYSEIDVPEAVPSSLLSYRTLLNGGQLPDAFFNLPMDEQQQLLNDAHILRQIPILPRPGSIFNPIQDPHNSSYTTPQVTPSGGHVTPPPTISSSSSPPLVKTIAKKTESKLNVAVDALALRKFYTSARDVWKRRNALPPSESELLEQGESWIVENSGRAEQIGQRLGLEEGEASAFLEEGVAAVGGAETVGVGLAAVSEVAPFIALAGGAYEGIQYLKQKGVVGALHPDAIQHIMSAPTGSERAHRFINTLGPGVQNVVQDVVSNAKAIGTDLIKEGAKEIGGEIFKSIKDYGVQHIKELGAGALDLIKSGASLFFP